MIARDEDALICDLAETYGILDYQALSPSLVATLAYGLRDDSRIKMNLAGVTIRAETQLMAAILDGVNQVAWLNSKNGQKGKNRPKSVVKELARVNEQKVDTFNSLDDFKRAWNGD